MRTGTKENTLELEDLYRRIRVKEPDFPKEERRMLWERIAVKSIYKGKFVHSMRLLRYTAAVVSALIILGGGYWIYDRLHGRPSIDYLSIMKECTDDEWNNNAIRLILPSREEITIPDVTVELIHNREGDIQINTDQVITGMESEKEAELQFNQLIVPYGHYSNLVLSDGTKIWMNSGSKVIYPQNFAKNKREIFIEGEAYLEVAKDKQRPFCVKTELWEVKVTGTSFNVCAYKGELTQSVVLATGSIRLKNLVSREQIQLKLNQMCSYEYGDERVNVSEVEIYDHICWKYGFLHFKSERLDVVLHRMKRFYNIPIECSDRVKAIRVSGKLDMKEDIQEVLKNIALTAPVRYTQKRNKIIMDVQPLKQF